MGTVVIVGMSFYRALKTVQWCCPFSQTSWWRTVEHCAYQFSCGHGCKMTLLGAYISSALHDIFINGKKDYTVYTYVWLEETGLSFNFVDILVQGVLVCGSWFFFVFCLLLCSHSIILQLHREVKWILPVLWWNLSVKMSARRINSPRSTDKIKTLTDDNAPSLHQPLPKFFWDGSA